MRVWVKLTISLAVGVFLSVGVHADLVIVSPFDFEAPSLVYAYSDLKAQIMDTPPGPARPLNVFELSPNMIPLPLESVIFFPEGGYGLNPPPPPQTPPVHIISDDDISSFSLCLSALLSLGVCHSMRSARRLSFGLNLQWFHSGGLFQVVHSMAVDLDSVNPVPVCCFIQPVPDAADIALQRHFETVLSLWRKSQFTPDVLTSSRGPPALA